MEHAPWPRILFAQRTDPGREPEKQENEDASFYVETHLGHLLVLCDGMGGHSSGREASNLAIRTIHDLVTQAPRGSAPGDTLKEAVKAAGRSVHAFGGPPSTVGRPGSTCVAMLMSPLGTDVAHVGDSRLYVVRSGQIWPLTRDHSMVQQLVDAGLLRKEDAIGHPDSNKITRALGMAADVEVELRPDPIPQQRRDLFMLVSDGVTDVLVDSDLLAIATLALETQDLEGLCEQVVKLANARGGPDNITVQAALVTEPGLLPEAVRAQARPRTITDDPTANSDRITPPGEPSPSTLRLQAAPAVAPYGPPPSPSGDTEPAPVVAPIAAPRRPGSGGTLKLAIHTIPALATPLPRSGDPMPEGPRARPPATVVDPTSPGEEDDAPPATAARGTPPSRAKRVVIGLAMMAVGAVVASVSFGALLFNDEAPAPLVEHPRPPPATSASAP